MAAPIPLAVWELCRQPMDSSATEHAPPIRHRTKSRSRSPILQPFNSSLRRSVILGHSIETTQPRTPTPPPERSLLIPTWPLPASPSYRAIEHYLKSIGARRFELPTPCSRSRCATKLRYAPSLLDLAKTSKVYCPISWSKMQPLVFSSS